MTEKEGSRRRGFSTLELFVVIGVILILVGVVSLNATNLIAEARRESALGQVAAVFRAARQAAQTLNEERRVVLEVTYSGDAQTQAEAYDLDPVLRYWVERKRVRTKDWDEESPDRYASPPLDDVQTLPPGITLVDINGRGLIPENLNSGESNPDGTRSLKTFVVFNSKGVVIRQNVVTIRVIGRNTQGVRLIRLDEDDRVGDAVRVPKANGINGNGNGNGDVDESEPQGEEAAGDSEGEA